MKHKKKRISKITSEIMNYYFYLGSTSIDIRIQETDSAFHISFKGDYEPEKKEKINQLIQALQLERNPEMEEYYWELAGECDIDSELNLIGMMVDHGDVHLTEEFLEVHLERFKQ